MSLPEPWLRGEHLDTHPVIAALFASFQHAREDLRKWAGPLTREQMWRSFGEVAPVGFQIKHIAGSVDRLMTYVRGAQLSAEQLATLKREKEPDEADLFEVLEAALTSAEATARAIDGRKLDEVRLIGRKEVPVRLGVLLVHIAEHTQRHVGAAIVTAKLAAR
jgi:uncharacterized damage-inducible protein DinB